MLEAQEKRWGTFDCARFVAGAVEAMTGTNPHEIEYVDPLTAAQALRDYGSGTLYNYMRRHFNNPVHPSRAQRGDVLEYGDKSGTCFGILFARSGWFLGETGFVTMSQFDCKRAWKVPFDG
jgi:hypothetical protein